MLTQTVEYALRAMIHLSAMSPNTSARSETIAVSTKVPQGYLSKILRDLVVANLIVSQRGPNGGFSLARSAGQISMLDVVNAVDPMQRITRCPLGNPSHINLCPLHRRIDDAVAMIEHEFRSASLAEVLASSAESESDCQTLLGVSISRPNDQGE